MNRKLCLYAPTQKTWRLKGPELMRRYWLTFIESCCQQQVHLTWIWPGWRLCHNKACIRVTVMKIFCCYYSVETFVHRCYYFVMVVTTIPLQETTNQNNDLILNNIFCSVKGNYAAWQWQKEMRWKGETPHVNLFWCCWCCYRSSS